MTRKEVQNSLLDQLRLQNKVSDFYVDLVNDYMDYWTLKKKLIADIRKKGLRYETVHFYPDWNVEGAKIMKNKEYWIKWAKAAGVRAVKTVAQTFVATIGTAAVLQDVNWVMVLSASALSGVISLATSVAGLPEVTIEETE